MELIINVGARTADDAGTADAARTTVRDEARSFVDDLADLGLDVRDVTLDGADIMPTKVERARDDITTITKRLRAGDYDGDRDSLATALAGVLEDLDDDTTTTDSTPSAGTEGASPAGGVALPDEPQADTPGVSATGVTAG